MNSRLIAVIIASTFLISGCDQDQTSPASDNPSNAADPTVPVVRVETRDVVRTIDLPASVEGIAEADLYAKIAGHVAEVKVDIGDVVDAGDELVRLSVPELDAELAQRTAEVEGTRARLEQAQVLKAQAEAELEVAQAEAAEAEARVAEKRALVQLRKAEYARWQKLLEGAPAIEKRRLDEARYQLEAAQAALNAAEAAVRTARARVQAAEAAVKSRAAAAAAAEKDLAVATAALRKTQALLQYTVLRAPWPGRVVRRSVHPGDFALPASSNSAARPLLRLARIDRVRVVAFVPAADSRYLDPGDPATLHDFKTAPDRRIRASVTRIAPAYEQSTRLMRVEVHIDNVPSDNGLFAFLPGAFGYMTIELVRYENATVVPSTALLTDNETGRPFVLVVLEDQTLERREVTVEYDTGQIAVLSAGVKPGELVVRTGGGKLSAGQRVVPAE